MWILNFPTFCSEDHAKQCISQEKGVSSSLSVLNVKMVIVQILVGVFLYVDSLQIFTFFKAEAFRTNTRYILFAHTLVVVCMVLMLTDLVLLWTYFYVLVPVALGICLCLIMRILTYATPLTLTAMCLEHYVAICLPLSNTPFILATMSLERYIAICYPLRHKEICRVDRTWVVILALWLTSCIIPTINFALVGSYSIDVYSTPVTCMTKLLNSSHIQKLFKVSVNALFLALVATVILSTYVRILLKAKRMRSDKAPVNKALHTVILHGVQLLLCMMSYTYPVTEGLIVVQVGWLREHISFFNYFCFILLPRFLSPLIYGLRDENLRVHMKGSIQCCSTKINPNASGNKFIK
ncbi:OR4K2 protein, partial [Amia calva]|nr:OR4K2 protein [Amia calva]